MSLYLVWTTITKHLGCSSRVSANTTVQFFSFSLVVSIHLNNIYLIFICPTCHLQQVVWVKVRNGRSWNQHTRHWMIKKGFFATTSISSTEKQPDSSKSLETCSISSITAWTELTMNKSELALNKLFVQLISMPTPPQNKVDSQDSEATWKNYTFL